MNGDKVGSEFLADYDARRRFASWPTASDVQIKKASARRSADAEEVKTIKLTVNLDQCRSWEDVTSSDLVEDYLRVDVENDAEVCKFVETYGPMNIFNKSFDRTKSGLDTSHQRFVVRHFQFSTLTRIKSAFIDGDKERLMEAVVNYVDGFGSGLFTDPQPGNDLQVELNKLKWTGGNLAPHLLTPAIAITLARTILVSLQPIHQPQFLTASWDRESGHIGEELRFYGLEDAIHWAMWMELLKGGIRLCKHWAPNHEVCKKFFRPGRIPDYCSTDCKKAARKQRKRSEESDKFRRTADAAYQKFEAKFSGAKLTLKMLGYIQSQGVNTKRNRVSKYIEKKRTP